MISTTVGGVTTQFSYNGDGARLKQIIAGTVTTYTQDLAAPLPVVLQSQTGADATQYMYALGTRPLAQYGAAWEYLLPDALGSVRQIVDANGNVTLAESYEPYGSVLNSTGTASSIFRYSGEEVDTTGLIYLRARYMQPTSGMFLSHDPWSGDEMRPGSMNGFNYVQGNPINQTDPNGQSSFAEAECTRLGWWGLAKDFYCVPIVDGDNIRAYLLAKGPLVWGESVMGWAHGAYNIRHYVHVEDSRDVTYSSIWYLSETPFNQGWRRQLRDKLIQHEGLANGTTFCGLQFDKQPVADVFNAEGDVKAALGQHLIYALVVQPNVAPLLYDCTCSEEYYIQYYIDDPFDFAPKKGGTPDYLNTTASALGLGLTPFEWLDKLVYLHPPLAHIFRTRVFWAERVNTKNHISEILPDVDLRTPGNHSVYVIQP